MVTLTKNYIISADDLSKINIVKIRLLKEDRLSGDDMRNLAKFLSSVIENAVPDAVAGDAEGGAHG